MLYFLYRDSNCRSLHHLRTFTLPSKPPPVLFLSLQVTAFHEACYEGDLAIAKHLLKVVALHCLYAQYLLLMLWLWSSLSCLTFLAV